MMKNMFGIECSPLSEEIVKILLLPTPNPQHSLFAALKDNADIL